MRMIKFAAAALVVQAVLFAAASANAAVVLSYTGNDFTTVFAPGYTTSDKITGTLTLSSALPLSLTTLTDETSLVTSYSFSDGVNTFTKPCCDTGNQTVFDFTTNASGAITGWVVVLETNDNHTGDLTTEGGGPSPFDQSLVGGVLGGDNAGTPGVWSVQSAMGVPEPGTWTLLLFGIGAIGWTLRRARKAAPAALLR